MRADLQLAKRKRHGVQLRISSQKRVFMLASASKSGAVVLSDRAREGKEAKQRTKIATAHRFAYGVQYCDVLGFHTQES
jgi:hypothetical protein